MLWLNWFTQIEHRATNIISRLYVSIAWCFFGSVFSMIKHMLVSRHFIEYLNSHWRCWLF
ncbi:hypothetical protein XF_0126 [Xylella fastidiosa 9a5c]|uniref:Uncharacterized protein n=1 Tax=Xylella fastidiosa (strain 9a5c) TaxID=160492 RepID=Q9PH20_XYLFA|nr:hypothetical protein XF_0126 [Xylella fastidiosa 9a5c]